MAQRFLTDPAGNGVGYPIIGSASVEFSVADPVYIDTSGYLAIATTRAKVLGFCLENITMSSTNTTVAKVCPKYVANPSVLVVIPTTSSVGFAQTAIGEYATIETATTGAFTVSATSSSTGQFLIVGIDPKGDGTSYEAVLKTAYKQEDTGMASNF